MEPIIVIGRLYGAGGRKIGRELARRFGLPYYDRELLSEAASRLGISRHVFDKADERRPSLIDSLLSFGNGVTQAFGTSPMSREGIYDSQSGVIRQLASEGGAVFVGRSADYILRHHPGLVSIFLHAPEDVRVARLIERGEAPDETTARERLRHADSDRENFYNYFTGRPWGHADNYDLTLDSSHLDTKATADLLETFIRHTLERREKAGIDRLESRRCR
ncbi:MAG: cytidylate kinase-like family protein [Muribaculaceae bacterium]|nr:cytidylate kinase-like family protein [Muribaculaceae bacterium]